MLRAASYNTLDCVGRDRHYAPERVAGVLAELRADIIALQEITLDPGGAMRALLERATGLRAITSTLLQRETGRYGNVLLMGDLNVWLGVRALAPLQRLGIRGRLIRSFPTWLFPLLPLDRVQIRGPAAVARCWRDDSPAARIASDHFPIVAEVQDSAMRSAS